MIRHRNLVGALLVVVAAGGLLVSGQGGVDTFRSSRSVMLGKPRAAPEWTAPCWRSAPRSDRRLLERCARVTGRVVWVQSDGPRDTHVALVAHWRVISVRVPRRVDAPGPLAYITAVGALVRDRTGIDELDAVEIE